MVGGKACAEQERERQHAKPGNDQRTRGMAPSRDGDDDGERDGDVINLALIEAERARHDAEPVLEEQGAENRRRAGSRNDKRRRHGGIAWQERSGRRGHRKASAAASDITRAGPDVDGAALQQSVPVAGGQGDAAAGLSRQRILPNVLERGVAILLGSGRTSGQMRNATCRGALGGPRRSRRPAPPLTDPPPGLYSRLGA